MTASVPEFSGWYPYLTQRSRQWAWDLSRILGFWIVLFNAGAYLAMVPAISGSLGRSVDDGIWTQDFYFLSLGLSLPLLPWLHARWGRQRVLLWSFGIFALCSVLVASTSNFCLLLLARVVAAWVGGWSLPLLAQEGARPGSARHQQVGNLFWTWAATIPFALGPFWGGWITDTWGWRWLFVLDIPFSALIILGVFLGGQEEWHPTKLSFDWVGYLLLSLAAILAEMLLNLGNIRDWWHSSLIQVLFWLAFWTALASFLWLWSHPYPALRVSLLGSWNFLIAAVGTWLGALLFVGGLALLVVHYQLSFGYSAELIGYYVLPMAILGPVVLILAQSHWRLLFPRFFLGLPSLLLAAAAFAMGSFALPISPGALFVPMLLAGGGLGWLFPAWNSLALDSLPKERKEEGARLLNWLRYLGLSMGIPAAIGFWERRVVLHRHFLVEDRAWQGQLWEHTLQHFSKGLSVPGAEQFLAKQMAIQAQMLAFNEVFWVAAWGFLGLGLWSVLARFSVSS